jgi:hypothetical protein
MSYGKAGLTKNLELRKMTLLVDDTILINADFCHNAFLDITVSLYPWFEKYCWIIFTLHSTVQSVVRISLCIFMCERVSVWGLTMGQFDIS